VVLADMQQGRQADTGGRTRGRWHAPGGLHPIFERFAAVLEERPELEVKFLLRMARILNALSNVQTLSDPFSLDHFRLEACRLAHKSLIDLLIVKRELEQDDRQIQYYPLAVICPLEAHFTDLQMTLHSITALRDAVVCSIAHVIRHLPAAASDWTRKEEVRREESLKQEQLKNAAITLYLSKNQEGEIEKLSASLSEGGRPSKRPRGEGVGGVGGGGGTVEKRARRKEQSELGAGVAEKQPIPVKRAKRATEKEPTAPESELAAGVESTTNIAVKRAGKRAKRATEKEPIAAEKGVGSTTNIAVKQEKVCEHNRRKSQCTQCGGASICEHNRRRCTCKQCGGSGICEHNRIRSRCTQCGGSSICEHNRIRNRCTQCGGSGICEHNRIRCECTQCGGASICEHSRIRSQCTQCGGSGICEHSRIRSRCTQCGGSAICEHNRRRSLCKQCGGSSICEHNREKSKCKQCGGSGICEHNRRRCTCKQCGIAKQIETLALEASASLIGDSVVIA
jgi:hypothetical protein